MAAIDKLKSTGFKHKYSFDEGLATTIEYFKSIPMALVKLKNYTCTYSQQGYNFV